MVQVVPVVVIVVAPGTVVVVTVNEKNMCINNIKNAPDIQNIVRRVALKWEYFNNMSIVIQEVPGVVIVVAPGAVEVVTVNENTNI